MTPNHNDAIITVEEYKSALGSLDAERGLKQSAQKWDDKAMATLTAMHNQAPSEVLLFEVLSKAQIASLILDGKVGRSAAAERIAAIRRYIEQKRVEAEHDPKNIGARARCVTGLLALAERSKVSARPADALARLKEARAVLAPGLRAAPKVLRFRALEVELETLRGEVLRQLGNADAASAAAHRAVSVAEALAGEDRAYLYALACARALQCRFDPTAPAPPGSGVKALREAALAGYDNLYKLENDHRLEPLRARNDFQALIHTMREEQAKDAAPSEAPAP
jgi:hypothetical protein